MSGASLGLSQRAAETWSGAYPHLQPRFPAQGTGEIFVLVGLGLIVVAALIELHARLRARRIGRRYGS